MADFIKHHRGTAAFDIDVFSFGRILQWITDAECLWPSCLESDKQKEEWLASNDIDLDRNIFTHEALRSLIASMLKKNPKNRATLDMIMVILWLFMSEIGIFGSWHREVPYITWKGAFKFNVLSQPAHGN